MKTITLDEHLARVSARKAELGIEDTEEQTEAMRNKGGSRTPEKRELLGRTAQRAIDAGLEPQKAYF
jgi:hypothetical protein